MSKSYEEAMEEALKVLDEEQSADEKGIVADDATNESDTDAQTTADEQKSVEDVKTTEEEQSAADSADGTVVSDSTDSVDDTAQQQDAGKGWYASLPADVKKQMRRQERELKKTRRELERYDERLRYYESQRVESEAEKQQRELQSYQQKAEIDAFMNNVTHTLNNQYAQLSDADKQVFDGAWADFQEDTSLEEKFQTLQVLTSSPLGMRAIVDIMNDQREVTRLARMSDAASAEYVAAYIDDLKTGVVSMATPAQVATAAQQKPAVTTAKRPPAKAAPARADTTPTSSRDSSAKKKLHDMSPDELWNDFQS